MKKIKKGYVYVVTDIDINGKCKHGFVPLKDVLINEKGTAVGDLIKKRDDEIKHLKYEIGILKRAFKNLIANVGGVSEDEITK